MNKRKLKFKMALKRLWKKYTNSKAYYEECWENILLIGRLRAKAFEEHRDVRAVIKEYFDANPDKDFFII